VRRKEREREREEREKKERRKREERESVVCTELLGADGYGPAVDMWALGVIFYMLLVGFPPFFHENVPALFGLIKVLSPLAPLMYFPLSRRASSASPPLTGGGCPRPARP